MEGELLALASTGATALVAAMASDAWAQVRDRVADFFGRGGPQDAVVGELRRHQAELSTAAADGGDLGPTADVEDVWRARLRRILRSDPAAAEELRALLAELAPFVEEAGGVRNSITGGVQHGPVVQGRDFANLTFYASTPGHTSSSEYLPPSEPEGDPEPP